MAQVCLSFPKETQWCATLPVPKCFFVYFSLVWRSIATPIFSSWFIHDPSHIPDDANNFFEHGIGLSLTIFTYFLLSPLKPNTTRTNKSYRVGRILILTMGGAAHTCQPNDPIPCYNHREVLKTFDKRFSFILHACTYWCHNTVFNFSSVYIP